MLFPYKNFRISLTRSEVDALFHSLEGATDKSFANVKNSTTQKTTNKMEIVSSDVEPGLK